MIEEKRKSSCDNIVDIEETRGKLQNNTKRSGEMADAWEIGEIRWNKQNLLYRKIFIRRLNG